MKRNSASAQGQNGTVLIETLALDPCNQYSWKYRLSLHATIRDLAVAFAGSHGVPATAVGFGFLDGEDLEMDKEASSFGWKAGQHVKLQAFPVDPIFIVQEKGAPQPPVKKAKKDVAAANVTAKENGKSKKEKEKEEKQSAKAARQASAEAVSKENSKTQKAKDEEKQTAKAARQVVKESSKDSGKAKGSAAEEAGGKSQKDEKLRSVPTSDLPGEDDPIEFDVVNKKRMGSAAWERFEKYKQAKTMRQALELGAARGDIKYDLKSGLCRKL